MPDTRRDTNRAMQTQGKADLKILRDVYEARVARLFARVSASFSRTRPTPND
jgi:hypothetical protein